MAQKITPHLWFDKEAKEAAEFYASIFSAQGGQAESRITNVTTLHNTPSGDADIVSFELRGQPFMAISAGPYFKLNPSISFMVNFDPSQDKDAKTRIDAVWGKLADGGKVLMPIDKYPFSERYGWIQDKYGLSWQLILTNPEGEPRPFFIPFGLMLLSRPIKVSSTSTTPPPTPNGANAPSRMASLIRCDMNHADLRVIPSERCSWFELIPFLLLAIRKIA